MGNSFVMFGVSMETFKAILGNRSHKKVASPWATAICQWVKSVI